MKNKDNSLQKLSLFAITWPILVETTMHMLMGNADTLMLSQYSDEAVAAVGVSNQILSIMIVMFGFIVTGTSVLIAQFLGAKIPKDAGRIAVVSLFFNVLLGVMISFILIFFGSKLLMYMGVSKNILHDATLYLQIVGGGIFLQSGMMTIGAIFRSYRFTKDVMLVTLGINFVNIIGNSLFIFGIFGFPVLGVTGVAISTVISRTIGLFILLFLFHKRLSKDLYPITMFRKFPSDEFKKLLKVGVPSAGEHLSFNGSQLVITAFIVMIGTEAMTTKVYVQNIGMLILLFSLAIGQGTQIIVGHLVGARQYDDAYKRCIDSLIIAISITSVVGLIIYVFSSKILHLFTTNHDIIELGSILLLLTALVEPGRAFNAVVINSLRAAGDVNFPVFIGVLSMWGISVPLAYMLGIHVGLGLVGIWIAFIVDEWLRGVLMLFRWRQGKWRNIVVKKVETNAS
ncbi:MATE family efflux transporter [Metabacillus litoralis]|uniref:MATE family efflux transporter n=1 Tax=Metabacillus litoralis TaxID=152268 RepID=UPI001B985054|nr:MATE family efflux transporter [Metabacillus litoralis]UHA59920.1 MATE family efflux transporter [Metabacillus litoralis]